MKKPNRILILHGWEGDPNLYWIPEAKRRLESLGYEVSTPKMPGGYFPKKEEWQKVIDSFNPDENWILIGHSLGGVAILNYLSTTKKPISKAIFIATPFEPMQFNPIANFFDGFNWDQIRKNADKIIVLNESNDEVVPPNHGELLANSLGVKLILIPGFSHFHILDLGLLERLIQ